MSAKQSLLKPDFVSQQVTEAQRYFLDLNPSKSSRLVAVCGGRERCLPEYTVQREDFRFHCVEFVAEGGGTVWLNGKAFDLKPGSAFYYGPGVPHRIVTSRRQLMLKYYIDFAGTAARRLIGQGPLSRGQVIAVAETHEVLELFELLQRHGTGERKFVRETCAALVEALLYRLAEPAMPAEDADTRALGSFQRLKRRIEESFLETRHLKEAVEAAHLNEAYACRLFQRFHHCSPYQYLMRLKMNHAANRLLEGGRLVKEVAEELGFPDPYNFSRAFKTVYGLSPEKFAKQNGAGRSRL